MKYEDIKPYNKRCEKFQGIVTNERLMEVLIEEIEQLRDYIESQINKYPVYTSPPQRKPLTDAEILKMWDDTRNDPIAPSVFCLIACVRHVERTHGIGGKV